MDDMPNQLHDHLLNQSPCPQRWCWDSKRKPWANRVKYLLVTCTPQPPAMPRALAVASGWTHGPRALPATHSPSFWSLGVFFCKGRWDVWAAWAGLTLQMGAVQKPMPSITDHVSACSATNFCGKCQGTPNFNRANFSSPLVQPWGWSCPVCYSDGVPSLWASYRQWSEMSHHLHECLVCSNSGNIAWKSTCLKQLLSFLAALQEQSTNLKSYFLHVISPRRTEILISNSSHQVLPSFSLCFL